MRNLRTRLLLASVLAIGAQLAGCDDVADCPARVANHTTCSSAGLTCNVGPEQCTCTGGSWQCQPPDMHQLVDIYDVPHHD